MRTTLVVISGILALTTSVHETTELLPTKLAARLFIYGQMLVTWHLWACGSSWKLISLHILGILTSMSLDTTTPHHTTYGLLLHACGYLFIIVSTFNKDKHVRTVSQLFSSSPPPSLSPIPWLKILNSTYIFLFFYFPIDRFTLKSRIFNQGMGWRLL